VCRRWDDVVTVLRRLARRAWLREKVQESQEERDMVKLLFSMLSAIERKYCGTDCQSVLHAPGAQPER
jgi:predicted membrane chloride channel (bestrophin family)